MGGNRAKTFRAALEPLRGGLGWVVARLPFDPKSAWSGMVRLRVKGEISAGRAAAAREPFAFRTSLFPFSDGSGYFVLVNKKMQKAAGVGVGMEAAFRLEPDLEERPAAVPAELKPLLAQDKGLARWYAALSEATRREIAKWIAGVKSADARRRRAEQMAERLMLAMEGERELPPIFELAFRREPRARKGWEAMTQARRRGHLLGVFYYQSPEAREKRVQKVVEEALGMLE